MSNPQHDPSAGPSRYKIAQSTLPFALKTALGKARYTFFDEVVKFSPEDLTTELSIPLYQVEEILRYASDPDIETLAQAPGTIHPGVRSTPVSVLLASSPKCRFSTFSEPIDRLIGHFTDSTIPPDKGRGRVGATGIIAPRMSVEIAGPPGSGKTAMSIALALSARLGRWRAAEDDGYEEEDEDIGEVLLIDTEGGISPERLKQASESATRCTNQSPLQALRGVHLLRIATQVQMIALLHTLDDWLILHPKVNLIIIDTLSFHFRQPSLDMRAKSRIMELQVACKSPLIGRVKQQIGKATSARKCAVVVMNQLATKLLTAENKPANFDTGDRAVLMPQLGDAWTTAKTIRVVLFRGRKGDEMRYAHASSEGNAEVPWMRYDIDNDGLPCDPVDI